MDNDNFYKVIRLKTGESIICTMQQDIQSSATETHLCLNLPVQVVPMRETRKDNQVIGESFMLRPWIGLSDSTEFVISADIVLTMGDLKPEVREQYDRYMFHVTETQKRLEISNAVIEFLREVTPGEVRIIDIDNHGEQYGEDEEG
jgi:hypothetical protein